MFKKGDIVQAKKEFIDAHETLDDTVGIVVDYNPDNDYLGVGVLNPEDYALPPIFSGRGSCYEVVPANSARANEIECNLLKKKREKIQKVLSKRQDEIYAINQQIRAVEVKQFVKTLEEQGIKEGTFFAGFSRNLDYHCQLVKLIKVEKVSPVGRIIHCVESEYRVDAGYYSFHIAKSKCTKASFAALAEDFETIQIDSSVYENLFEHLVNLEVNIESLDKIKACIKENKKILI